MLCIEALLWHAIRYCMYTCWQHVNSNTLHTCGALNVGSSTCTRFPKSIGHLGVCCIVVCAIIRRCRSLCVMFTIRHCGICMGREISHRCVKVMPLHIAYSDYSNHALCESVTLGLLGAYLKTTNWACPCGRVPLFRIVRHLSKGW